MLSKRVFKTLLIVMVALALSGFTYAFAAANTVPGTRAGDGTGAISGYTVSNIVYNLNAANPGNIDSVSFSLNEAATTVKASVNGTTFADCTLSASTWTCTLPAATTVEAAVSLRVIAAN
ncbi:MAG: hypothetical protein GYA48_16550 [Chloroflexi bacterium]|nr:hypothetical protein [Chloroflexota bacterium]